MSAALFIGFLVALWVLLWGSLTVANVLGGLVVAGIVLLILPDSIVGGRKPPIRPFAAARLFGRIGWDLLVANLVVAREVVSPASAIHTGVVEVPMPHASDTVLTFVASVLALSPGILPLEVVDDPGAIYVHVLHLDDVERVRKDISHLASLAIRAFGSPEAIAALDDPSTIGAEP
jgi:multicomponent Na+:H+ antiporter subunit E